MKTPHNSHEVPELSRDPSIEELSFEDALHELEATVHRVEDAEMTLSQLLEAYARGVRLAQHCASLLDRAEMEIIEVNQWLNNNEEGSNHTPSVT